MVTNDGNAVLGQGGAITFGPQETGIQIATDGTISSSAGIKGRLQVVSFENPSALKKIGYTLYQADEASEPAEDVRILQGMVERSNVNPIREMTRMIETMRAYTSIAQSIQNTNRLRRTAIEQLGNTRNA